MVDLGMDGNVSSGTIDYKWNHGDPTVGSPRISLGSCEPLTTTFMPSPTTVHRFSPPQSTFTCRFPLITLSSLMQPSDVGRSSNKVGRGAAGRKKKKKKEEAYVGSEGKSEWANWELSSFSF